MSQQGNTPCVEHDPAAGRAKVVRVLPLVVSFASEATFPVETLPKFIPHLITGELTCGEPSEFNSKLELTKL